MNDPRNGQYQTRILSKSWAILTLFMLASCSSSNPQFQGFNFLQDDKTAMDNAATCLSMQHLLSTGANSVTLVPFLEQKHSQSTEIYQSKSVTDQQLIAAILLAKKHRLHVVIKPQILVEGSWAGTIKMATKEDEQKWFKQYKIHLKHYTRLAKMHGADAVVIGTELSGLEQSSHWPALIKTLRSEFRGALTYAANGIEGAEQFRYWSLLDNIGVTLYPAVEPQQDTGTVAREAIEQLAAISKSENRNIWILEVGIPSAEGWKAHPWDWRKLKTSNPTPDAYTQAQVIDHWLSSSLKPWIEGIWLWQWNSSPQSGGNHDIGYTVQNKLAQVVIQNHWQPHSSSFIPYQLSRKTVSCT